jgi:hypothetical protein
MRYAILAYENDADFSARTDQDRRQRYWAAWRAYDEALTAAGIKLGGAALQSVGTATTVRMNRDARQVQDGPYADTKEQLGGVVLIEVPDLDAALDWAARCPAAATHGAERGLALLEEIPPQLVAKHQPYWALRGHLLMSVERSLEAWEAYERAIAFSRDRAISAFLSDRLVGAMEQFWDEALERLRRAIERTRRNSTGQ